MKKLIHKDGYILFHSITEHPPNENKIKRIIKKYKNKSSKSEMVSIRIPDFLNEMLKVTAEREGISYSDYIRNLLSWPFLIPILENSLKDGFFSTEDEAKLELNEEIKQIDQILMDVERITFAEKAIQRIRTRVARMKSDLKEIYFNEVFNKDGIKKKV